MKYKITYRFGSLGTLRTTIEANSREDAEYKLRGKIDIMDIRELYEGDLGIFNDIFK